MSVIDKIKNAFVPESSSKFNQLIEDYQKRNPTATFEEGQKDAFERTLRFVAYEMSTHHMVDQKSPSFKMLEAGIQESFSDIEKRQFQQDANAGLYNIFMSTPATRRELSQTLNYFGKKNQGEMPDAFVAEDIVKILKEMDALINNLFANPDFTSSPDLRTAVTNDPTIGADLYRLRTLKKQLEQHESQFQKELAHRRNVEDLKQTGVNMLTKNVWGNTANCAKRVHHGAMAHNLAGTIDGTKALLGVTGKIAGGTGKLAGKALKTMFSFLNK